MGIFPWKSRAILNSLQNPSSLDIYHKNTYSGTLILSLNTYPPW